MDPVLVRNQAEGAPAVPYANRTEAAQRLAQRLLHYRGRTDVIVLALPRGGVPIGHEISSALQVPLDALLVRKLGYPGHEELAIGAIASGGVRVLNSEVARFVDAQALELIEARERRELQRRERLYRENRPFPDLRDRVVILADDGLATGATMRAAVKAVRNQHPARIVVAVPVGAEESVEELRSEADEVVCLLTPQPFYAIGLWYRDFGAVTDDRVRDLLNPAWRAQPAPQQDLSPALTSREVTVTSTGADLAGTLAVPRAPRGVVLFAHGSGSSRLSPRNREVSQALNEAGLATLLFDLLTPDEERLDERTRELRFDIELLTERLVGAIDWVQAQHEVAGLRVGLFGASTGAAAALRAAAARPSVVHGVVSRGGRPDLAGDALSAVRAPVLLIVGERDPDVLELNEGAAEQLHALHEVSIVPGATHLFEEPGALAEVSRAAREWFERYL